MVRIAVGHVVPEAGPSSAGALTADAAGGSELWVAGARAGGGGVTPEPFGGLPYLIAYVWKGKGRGGIVPSG